jgi:serine protease inhibitor
VWNASASVKLAVAARVFVEKSAPIEEGFLALTRDRYRAPSLAVSFDGDAEAARGTINRWFEARTDRRVRELLPAGALDRLTRLVLASAVAFKGTWKTRFDPAHTSPGIFTTAAGEAFEVPMMQMKAKLSWAKLADGTRVLELPYAGDEVRMILLLPATTAGLPTLEAALGVPALAQWRAALKHVNVVVALPRFKLEPTALRLKEELAALGVRRAFEKTADFTAIARLPKGSSVGLYHCPP